MGYCFVDTYYDGEASEDVVETYNESANEGEAAGENTFIMDPITCGEYDADQPEWGPREYFLMVLEVRLRRVKNEQKHLVSQFLKRVEAYVRVVVLPCFFYYSLPHLHRHSLNIFCL